MGILSRTRWLAWVVCLISSVWAYLFNAPEQCGKQLREKCETLTWVKEFLKVSINLAFMPSLQMSTIFLTQCASALPPWLQLPLPRLMGH
jgi:hypothetical protein